MKSLLDVATDLNAIKTERAHTRIALPSELQQEESVKVMDELLSGTGIDQGELATLSITAGHAAMQMIIRAGAEIGQDDLLGLMASVWLDGVTLGAVYMRDRDEEYEPTDAAIRLTQAEAGPASQNGTEPADGVGDVGEGRR